LSLTDNTGALGRRLGTSEGACGKSAADQAG